MRKAEKQTDDRGQINCKNGTKTKMYKVAHR